MTIAIMLFSVVIGIFIYVTDKKTEWIRWLTCIIFLAGLAAFANELEDLLIPFLKKSFIITDRTVSDILMLNAFLTQLCEHLIAYFFIMFCISYSGIFKRKFINLMSVFFFTITLTSFFYLPIMQNRERLKTNTFCSYYQFLSLWSVPLVIFGVLVLYKAFRKERNPRTKNQRFINLIIVIPMVLSAIINLYILRAFGIRNAFKYNAVIMILIFLTFLFLVYKYGAMGIHLKIENKQPFRQLTLYRRVLHF